MTHAKSSSVHSILRVLLILCAVTTLAWAPAEPSEPPQLKEPDFTKLQTGTVTRILDENTILIRVESKTVRFNLLGNKSIPSRDKHNTSKAIEALTRMILNEIVAIQYDPESSHATTHLHAAHLYRHPDHLPINLELIRQGYTKFSDRSMSIHSEVFAHYEARARYQLRGIWDPNAPKLLKPNDEYDGEDDAEPDSDQPATTTQEPAQAPGTIYITTYGTRYHRKDCPHLTDSARPASYDEVKDTHKPCKTCKPEG